jgi:hypothetical protein
MSCDVFANNDEIACKKGGNKVIAEFPDVCLSPPSPPAGPVPVPYPDTSFSKDMQNGSKTVKIKGGEVMLKDKSFYKTSPLGDEAATQGLGANVITHTITGKTYFVAWSMDVKFEGENVDRHMDMTTSNHMCSSAPGGTGPTSISSGAMSAPPGNPCKGVNCASVKEKIENIKAEIAKRQGELHEDPQGLPWDLPGPSKPRETRKGHVMLLNEHKANLAKQKGLYVACCGGDWDSL